MSAGYFAASFWPHKGLLVHGGVRSPNSQKPTSSLALFTIETSFDSNVELSSDGPSLSHHASCLVAFEGRDILVVVGGWNGSSRTNTVYGFDLKNNAWFKLNENVSGQHRIDPPVGLSGHTATAINSGLICVIGREGGVKTQRKFGQMFFLHLDLSQNSYWYSEAPILPESRSGHTAQLSPPMNDKSNVELLVFGGRDSGLLDVCGRWTPNSVDIVPNSFEAIKRKLNLHESGLEVMMGLRYHAMVVLTSDCFLIHGGRNFKAISSKNVNGNLYACKRKQPYTKNNVKWSQVQLKTATKRFAHHLLAFEDDLYVIGGFENEADKSAASTEKLQL